MSDYYSEPDNNNSGKDVGQTTFVLGLLSLLFQTVLGGITIAAFVLGILAVVKGGRLKRAGYNTSLLSAGYIMGLIGLILSSIVVVLFSMLFGIAFIIPLFLLI